MTQDDFQIKGVPKGEIESKRFHLDGVKIHYKCPKCQKSDIDDLEHEHLCFPDMNKDFFTQHLLQNMRPFLGCNC